jgi:hypothetical protein
MRTRAWTLLGGTIAVVSCAGFVAGCGSDSSTTDDGGADATYDCACIDASPADMGSHVDGSGGDGGGDAATNDSGGGDATTDGGSDGASDAAAEAGDDGGSEGGADAGDSGADAASDGSGGDGASDAGGGDAGDDGGDAGDDGGDGGDAGDDGGDGGDAGDDGGDGGDAGDGGISPVDCPAQPCNMSDSCCAVGTDAGPVLQCLATCPNGEGPIDCTSPVNCGGNTPYCCITATVGAGQIPNCKFLTASSSCTASCITALQATCNATDIARACDQVADCDAQHDNCCALPLGMYSPYVCVDTLTKNFLGLTCK